MPRNGCRTPVTRLHVVADTASQRRRREQPASFGMGIGGKQQGARNGVGASTSFAYSSFVDHDQPGPGDASAVARFDLLVSSAPAGTVQALELPSGATLGCCANHSGGEDPDPMIGIGCVNSNINEVA